MKNFKTFGLSDSESAFGIPQKKISIVEWRKRLAAAGNGNAKRSVEELAAHVLGCKPLEIYFRELSAAQEEHLEILIDRAELGEPIQYIIGHVDFRGLEIHCDRRALIPRPETEQLVEQVLQAVAGGEWRVASELKVADVGCGTGCISLSLLHELPNAEVVAVDISPEALALAQENAERLGLSGRFQCLENNLLEGFAEASLDVVVSNPPYILSSVLAAPEPNGEGGWKNIEPCVRDFEPHLALDGGADGLDLIRPLVAQAAQVLRPGGGLFIEIGYDQGSAVSKCLEDACFKQITVIKDLSGLDRIVRGIII